MVDKHPDFENHCWQDLVSPEILEIYKHYSRDTAVGARPALLAIDLYKRVYEGGPLPVIEAIKDFPSSCGENAWNAIAPTQRLFKSARAAGIPVFYSTGPKGSRASAAISATNRQEEEDQAADTMEIKEEFLPQPDDIVIVKERASVFFGTPLIAHLNRLDVGSLIICGESTSGCVRASAVDSYSYGFHTVLVEECCFDRSMLSHKVNLFDLHHKYADVMNVDTVCAHLDEFVPTAKEA